MRPFQNRVLPTGEIVALPVRGTMTGNRGIIHRADQTLGTARWTHHAWICCTLNWQGRKREVMTGRNWTELFFLDEAVALAAGHRPCAYCRRQAYAAFKAAWAAAQGTDPKAPEMDQALHAARIEPGTRNQSRYRANIAGLPAGVFVTINDRPHLLSDDAAYPYHPQGYGAPIRRAYQGRVIVLTPAPTVAALRAGFAPFLHPSAQQLPG